MVNKIVDLLLKVGENSLSFYLMQGLVFMIFTKLIILPSILVIILLFPVCSLLAYIFKKVDIKCQSILENLIYLPYEK